MSDSNSMTSEVSMLAFGAIKHFIFISRALPCAVFSTPHIKWTPTNYWIVFRRLLSLTIYSSVTWYQFSFFQALRKSWKPQKNISCFAMFAKVEYSARGNLHTLVSGNRCSAAQGCRIKCILGLPRCQNGCPTLTEIDTSPVLTENSTAASSKQLRKKLFGRKQRKF